MNYSIWKIPYDSPERAPELEKAGYTPLLGIILRMRGYDTPEKVRAFLGGGADDLCDPFLLSDMDKAVGRIRRAVDSGERVAVYGDYDVDGITSTCLLTGFLRSLGLECEPYIPDRMEEGYGLNSAAVDALASRGATLIITVDCGVTGIAEAQHAQEIGVDMIITDHHECMDELPPAVAVVDPKRPDSRYPNTSLAGVGVAFKLICAIDGSVENCLDRYCDLVAVGTVADVMPLTGENRVITGAGLKKLKDHPRAGLLALMKEAGIGDKQLTAGSIGFTLAPRLNAAGRLGQASRAAALLMSEDETRAAALASELCQLNRDRQALEGSIWQQALAMLGDTKPNAPIVLANSGWHQGVIGIVASRLTEAFGLPAIMICLDGENGKGSCRSYGGFNLFEALSSCSEFLDSFGGHALAAGLNINVDKISAFRQALAEYYRQNPPSNEISLDIDLRIDSPDLLSMKCVESLALLEPCGNGNARPVMCLVGAELVSVMPIGGGKHLRLRLGKFGQIYECIFFSHTQEELGLSPGDLVDAAFFPQINEFRSRRSVQLLISALRRHDPKPICRKILEGSALTPTDAADSLPRRADMVAVWRALEAQGGGFSGTLDELCRLSRSIGIYAPKLCAGLRAFDELGLVSLRGTADAPTAVIIPNAPKANLADSKLLGELESLAREQKRKETQYV
jgi:single-stranded-DNA-specific exonuclease